MIRLPLMTLALLWSCFSMASEVEGKANKPFVFLLYQNTTAPLAYPDPNGPGFLGIIPDVMQGAAEQMGVEVVMKIRSRKGAEQAVYEGIADGLIMAKEWARWPDGMLFTTPLFKHREFLFSLSPLPVTRDLEQLLDNKVVCTRLDYKYPQLDAVFRRGIGLKNTLSSHALMLQLLQKGRCDMVFMAEYRAELMINQMEIREKVYRSAYAVSNVGLTLGFNPGRKAFWSGFNRYVTELVKSGRMQTLLEKNTVNIDAEGLLAEP